MKNKCKRIFALLLTLLIVLSLAACNKDKNDTQYNSETSSSNTLEVKESKSQDSDENDSQSETVKSDGYTKFSQLEIGMTESDVNAILGEPAKIDKAYYYYNITVNGQNLEIQVWINTTSGLVSYFAGSFVGDEYRAEFADSETDLSSANDLDSGKLNTYEECASAFKTPGYLISVDEDGTKRYLWVDSNDGHLCVTFKADGSVKSYVGYC